MKNVLILIVALIGFSIGKTNAQAPDYSQAIKEKLAPLSGWVGKWKGEGTMQMGQAQAKTSVDEQIEWKLNGTILLINGLGKTIDPTTKEEKIVHEALGVVTYNVQEQKYKFNSWIRNGISTDAWFEIAGENKYQWGFETPQGKIKYSITLNPAAKTWNEIGEYSRDGSTWMKFFEMNLKKIE